MKNNLKKKSKIVGEFRMSSLDLMEHYEYTNRAPPVCKKCKEAIRRGTICIECAPLEAP